MKIKLKDYIDHTVNVAAAVINNETTQRKARSWLRRLSVEDKTKLIDERKNMFASGVAALMSCAQGEMLLAKTMTEKEKLALKQMRSKRKVKIKTRKKRS